MLISVAEYKFDAKGSWKPLKMFAPSDKPVELVKTTFADMKDESNLSGTTITSYLESRLQTNPSPADVQRITTRLEQ
jgi:hypothetical protein